MMRYKNVLFSILILSVFLLFACPISAPLAERAKAETSLEKAKRVQAQIFAQEKYENADENFKIGDGLIDKTKKSSENKKALKSYQMVKQDADFAYEQAVIPYSASLVEETEKQLKFAKEEGFDKNGGEYYAVALSDFDEAMVFYEGKKYDDFLEKIDSFDENINLARDFFDNLLNKLEEMQNKMYALDKKALKKKALNAVPESYEEIFQLKEQVIALLGEKDYGKAMTGFGNIVGKLEILLVAIEKKRRMTKKVLFGAEKVLDKVETRVKNHSKEIKIKNKRGNKSIVK